MDDMAWLLTVYPHYSHARLEVVFLAAHPTPHAWLHRFQTIHSVRCAHTDVGGANNPSAMQGRVQLTWLMTSWRPERSIF